MATTSLWHINGRLSDLVAYVENPEKTERPLRELDDLWAAAGYIQRPEATEGGRYVTAINCLAQTAVQQMITTKRQYGKDDGIIAYHGYQSFRPGEITPDTCHEIGVELARQMWGCRFQVLVTTHLDKDHLHNHFCLNSVSFVDGKKYNYSKSERRRMMELSDVLCKSYGLSVIQQPRKAPSRPVYLDEKDGKPTRYNVYRKDVEAALEGNCVPQHFERYLRQLGYQTDFTGAHWKIKLPRYQHYTRLETSLQALSAQRQSLYNQMRRASEDRMETLRSERDKISEQIAAVRKELKTAKAVEAGSLHIQETLDHVIDRERELRVKEKTSPERGIAR